MKRFTLDPRESVLRRWISGAALALLIIQPVAPLTYAGDPATERDEGDRSELSIVEPSRSGEWRRDLKFDGPKVRIPGDDPGKVISPIGPTAIQADTQGRWLNGYRPNTPKARAEFEAWKNRERLIRENGGDRRALAGAASPESILGSVTAQGSEDSPATHYLHPEKIEAVFVSGSDLVEQEETPDAKTQEPPKKKREYNRHNSGLTWEQYQALKDLADTAPDTPFAQDASKAATPRSMTSRAPGGFGVAFDAIASNAPAAPADPIMAAGTTHLLVIVNSRYQVFSKAGAALTPAITLSSLFSGVTGCSGSFDPFADYDEENDRFVIGAMSLPGGNQSRFCVAASVNNDPTSGWLTYSVRSDAVDTGAQGDYPHMGIGEQAVYITQNMFGDASGNFTGIRFYALDKADLYSGTLTMAEAAPPGATSFFTAQPAKNHGFTSGGWPAPGTPHHFVAHNNGGVTRIWRWTNPITQAPTTYGNLGDGFSGFVPPNAPESGGGFLQDTDTGRYFDAEHRDGKLWTTRAVNCNVGGGTAESCIDWLVFDVSGGSPLLLDQQSGNGYGSAGEYRYHPDLAVDRNNSMAIGYTKSSTSLFTGAWVTGRDVSNAAGTLQPEILQRQGTGNYTDGVGCNGTCDRWGDYTGMTIDPDGCTFWYLGMLSDGPSGIAFPWRTHVGSYKFPSCSVESAINVDRGTYNCDDTLTVTVSDSIRIDSATVSAQTTISTAGDSETIPAGDWSGSDCAGSDCGTWTATLAILGAAGSNNDGALNVADDGSINATYLDPHGGHSSRTRNAGVDCKPRIEDAGFLIDGGCELGAGAEQYRDYLDAGELIAYTFGILNPETSPPLSDVEATLSITGPASSLITIFNPTVEIGAMATGTLSGAVFQLQIDPLVDAPGLRLSEHDFNLSVTSVADGLTVPRVLTQQQLIQADDVISNHEECWNFETDEGFQRANIVTSYQVGATTVSTILAPWTRGGGCGSETRTDQPDMSCDVGGNQAFKTNGPNANSCNNFPQAATAIVDDVLYTPVLTPAHTGTAPSGQPWNYTWRLADWFYQSDMEAGAGNFAMAWGHYWSTDYTGVTTPVENDVNAGDWNLFLGFFVYPNQTWDSATPWDPGNTPGNYDGVNFDTSASGEATAGLQWRWAIEVFDADFGQNPTTTASTQGVAYDDMRLAYDQYYAEEQTGTCSLASGTAAFDQFTYQDCANGIAEVSVLDADGGAVMVTVTSDATGDSETVALAGSAPYFSLPVPYSTFDGTAVDDGTLFVAPVDIMRVTYDDTSPVGSSSDSAAIGCNGGAVTVIGVDSLLDNGDGDAFADNLETVDITLQIRNDTGQDLTNAVAIISTDDPDIDCITKDTASFGTIAASGGTAINNLGSDPFTFQVAATAECSDPATPPQARFNVVVLADGFDGALTPQQVTLLLDVDDPGPAPPVTANYGKAAPGTTPPTSSGSLGSPFPSVETMRDPLDARDFGQSEVAYRDTTCGNAQYDDGVSETASWFGGGNAGNSGCILGELFDPLDFGVLTNYDIDAVCFGNDIDFGGPWPNRWRVHPDNGGLPNDAITLAEGIVSTGNGTGQVQFNTTISMNASEKFWVIMRGDAGCCNGEDFNLEIDTTTVPASQSFRTSNSCLGVADLTIQSGGEFVIHPTLTPTAGGLVCDPNDNSGLPRACPLELTVSKNGSLVDLTFDDAGALDYNVYVSTQSESVTATPFDVENPDGKRDCSQATVDLGDTRTLTGYDVESSLGASNEFYIIVAVDVGGAGTIGKNTAEGERSATSFCP